MFSVNDLSTTLFEAPVSIRNFTSIPCIFLLQKCDNPLEEFLMISFNGLFKMFLIFAIKNHIETMSMNSQYHVRSVSIWFKLK